MVTQFVQKVVQNCLRIGGDDYVIIFTWRHMLDLAEAFALECQKSGACVHIEITNDELWYDSILNHSIDYLETPDPLELASAGFVTAGIYISTPENPERMKEVSAERWMAVSRAEKPVYEKLLERKVRMAQINLGLVTPQRAKTYGFDYQTWKKNAEEAIDVEYEEMQKLGRKVADALEKAKEVKVTNPDGTNLNFSLEGRKAHIYDGVIDDKDIEIGAIVENLPGGYVSVAPTEISANGVISSGIVFPSVGMLVHGISLRFEKGKLVSYEGGKNIDVCRNTWKKGSGDKDKIGWLTIGLNSKAKLGFSNNSIVLGTASIGVGFNRELGGTNESDYGLDVTLSKPTITLDGKIVIKQGTLTL